MRNDTTKGPARRRRGGDAVLVAHAQDGDTAAWAALCERYLDDVFGYVRRRVSDRRLAEEVTADVFVTARDRLGSFRQGDLGAWFIAVAREHVQEHLRSVGAGPVDRVSGDGDDLRAAYDADSAVGDAGLGDALTDMLAQLPQDQRDVIELRFVHDLSLADAAAALGRTVASTRVLQHRALESLAEATGKDPRVDGIVPGRFRPRR